MTDESTEKEKQRMRNINPFNPWRFFKIGAMVLLILAIVSTIIYHQLGVYYGVRWSVMDCLFMVVITLTTIGYGDWLDIRGKFFAEVYTMLLALAGVGVPAFIVSNLTALIVEGVLGDTVRRKRMQEEISKLRGHVVVCGGGSIGEHCIDELLKLRRQIVVIDRNEERLKSLQQSLGQFPYLIGDADQDDILKKAGVARAEGMICCLTDDKDNVFVALSARLLNPNFRIVSKGIEDHVRRKMLMAGTNAVVNPTAIGGLRLVSELVRPITVSFLDSMLRDRATVRFEEFEVDGASSLAGSTLGAANLKQKGDVQVVAARPAGSENFVYNPREDFVLKTGCVIVVLGLLSEIEKLRPLFEPKSC